MIIEKKDNYTLISQNSTDISLNNLLADLEEKYKSIENESVFVQLSEELTVKEEDFFVFLRYAELHNEAGTTFVLVHKGIDIDNFPEDFNIAPTLQEAEDILEMENIQRDLGF